MHDISCEGLRDATANGWGISVRWRLETCKLQLYESLVLTILCVAKLHHGHAQHTCHMHMYMYMYMWSREWGGSEGPREGPLGVWVMGSGLEVGGRWPLGCLVYVGCWTVSLESG